MPERWIRTARRASLLDMHIPDWDPSFLSRFDTKAYADALELAGIEAAYLYTSSCLGIANWPTPVGHQHAGPGGRDLVRELTEELHRRGKTVVLYYNFWSKWASDNHPDWRVVRPDGQGADDPILAKNRYGVCCLNSPYRTFVQESIRSLCAGYEFEGFWIDMLFWPLTVCCCVHCQGRYRAETGQQMPRTVNWGDPL